MLGFRSSPHTATTPWWLRNTFPTNIWLAVLLLGGLALFVILTRDGAMAAGGDNAMYLMHAQNLLTGTPYNATGYIQNPDAYLAPQAYPPGFPLVLVPALAAVGLDIGALHIYSGLLYVLSVALFAGLIRRDLIDTRAGSLAWLALIALSGFNPLILGYAPGLYSDGFFMASVFAALWALDSAYHRYDHSSAVLRAALLAGLLVAFASITRVFGLILIACVPLFDVLRYRCITRVGAVCLTTALVIYGLTQVLIAWDSVAITSGGNAGYGRLLVDALNQSRQLPAVIAQNIASYAYYTTYFLSLDPPWLSNPARLTNISIGITAITLLIALIGFATCVRRRFTPREIFCLLYVLALLPWMARGMRYLMPVVPLYLFYFLVGMRTLSGNRRYVFPAFVALSLGWCTMAYAGRITEDFSRRSANADDAPNGPAAMALYRYIETHTAEDAVIVFRKPRFIALFTRRRASSYTDSLNAMPNDVGMFSYMESIDAGYLLDMHTRDNPEITAFVARHPRRFTDVYSNNVYRLYRVKPDSND